MRPISVLAFLSIELMAAVTWAGGGRGGGSGGALGQVSAGMGAATRASAGGGGGGSSGGNGGVYVPPYYDPTPVDYGVPVVTGIAGPAVLLPAEPAPGREAGIDFYVGAQKVHDSDGMVTVDIGLYDNRFRIGGSVTRYYERQPGQSLTMTMPAFTLGLRIDDGGPTRVFIEAGGVGAKTEHDPVMDSSVMGALGGVRLEHQMNKRLALVGDAQVMGFEAGIRARALRVGARVACFQASFRVIDFNVGPALYGPELGLSF